MKDDEFIRDLSRDLPAVTRPLRLPVVVVLWLAVSVGYVAVLTVLLGPLRPDALQQLLSTPRFSLEMALGAGAACCFAVVVFAEAIPGIDARFARRLGVVLCVGWLAQFVLGFGYPALDPSMLGKRAHCGLEAYLYSVPPMLGALWLQHNRYPLRPLRAALYAALAAGMLPAVIMQIACMYEPGHILKFHILPIALLLAAVGGSGWLIAVIRR